MSWKHFTLDQFARSDTARARGIDNTPKAEYYDHVDQLVTTLLDPLRDAWGSDIIVTSGYRCEALNNAVGGSKTSAHSMAYAADMQPANGKIEEFKAFVMKWLCDNNYNFDQYINEYSGRSSWVHLAVKNRGGQQRKQYMLYQNGTYSSINPLTFKGGVDTNVQPISQPSMVSSTTSNNGLTVTNTWVSTTSNVGYGILTGRNIYLNDIDIEQIKNNDIFVKSEDGSPIIDPETGMYKVTDAYLIGLDENRMDEIESIDELEKAPDTGLDEMFAAMTSDVEESVSGIKYNIDGSYALEQSQTLREFMQMFWHWWSLVQSLNRAIDNYKENKVTASKDDNEDESQYSVTINAELMTKAAFDKLGHALRNGIICPVCGHRVKYLLPGGYCSTECMLKDVKNKVMASLLAPNDKYKDIQLILTELCQVLDYMTMIINALVCIPDIIKELAHIPERYKKYVRTKICEGFCELQVLIKKAMKKKNQLMAKFLAKMKLGVIMKPVAYVYAAIQPVQDAMQQVQMAVDKAYTTVMNTLTPLLSTGASIDAESFAWCCTPRSFISPMPYTCPDAGKLFVNLPGGSGLPKIELIKPLMPSGLCTINFAAIDAIIQQLFPPLTPLDYYLEPDLFEVRFLFSDQSDLVAQIRQQLTDFLSGGPDYIPSFENLLPLKKYTNVSMGGGIVIPELWLPNIGYLWFLIGLADAWGPHSQALVGSVINPEVGWVKTSKDDAEWHKYRIDTNYSPFVTLIDDSKDISELPDGEYKALFYANYFELCDTGEKYHTPSSPMMPREWAHPEWYIVYNGHVTQKYESLNSLEPGMYEAIMKDDLFRLKNTRTFDSYGYYLMHNAERNDGQWHIYKFDDGVLEICDDYTGKLGAFYRPPMSELPDGTYEVLEYGNKLEMRDGRIYTMPFVCKCSRQLTSWKKVKIKDGHFDNN